MSKKTLGVGVVGAGTVGGGVVKLLLNQKEMLSTRAHMPVELLGVADLNTERVASLGVPKDRITSDYKTLINNPDIDVIVELIGGTKLAYDVAHAALEAGKGVVTANKALLAERGASLFAIAKEKNIPLNFEAAVAGAIPIIRAMRDGLVANHFTSLLGIVNGTCNYILTQMLDAGQDYDTALKGAQDLGYAEADPTFDVGGFDSAHKLTLLAALGFETFPDFSSLHVEGIATLQAGDVSAARELGYAPKLLAVARPKGDTLFLSVHPALLPKGHPMASVSGSLNAISLMCDAAQESMFIGRGAGEMPTASAVVSDIVEIARNTAAGCNRQCWSPSDAPAYKLGDMNDYECRYMLRCSVADESGVLGRIATVLGEQDVSIASVLQHEKSENGNVSVVILTHMAREGSVRAALTAIDAMSCVKGGTSMLRVEG